MGKASRVKGHNYEREVAKLLNETEYGKTKPFKRTIQSRAGDEGPDVGNQELWIECKKGKRPNIPAAMRQAEGYIESSGDKRYPIVFSRIDRQDHLITMRLDCFKRMLEGFSCGDC